MGFPCKRDDDPLLKLLLPQSDNFPYAEERRLFYVAMTRAKKHIYFLVNDNDTSEFIYDIGADIEEDEEAISCSVCKKGKLIEREGVKGRPNFLGCTNYPYCMNTKKLNTDTWKG